MYATGDVEIRTIMEEIEETTLDEEGEETGDKNAEHNYGVAAQAGAGGSVFSIAGAVAVSIIDSAFKVSVDGILESGTGKIDMEANAVQYVQTIAAAEPVRSIAGKRIRRRNNRNNKGPSGKVGIGASFALADIKTNVSVKTANGAVLKSAREVKAKSNFTNRVTTKAESGDDVIEDDEGISDKLTGLLTGLKNKYSKTALDAAVAISIIDMTVEAVLGASQDPDIPNITAGGNLIVEAGLNSIIKTTSGSTAKATNAAGGTALSLNIIDGTVKADMGGYADVTGDVKITAKAYTVDESDAQATAKGVQLQRWYHKLGIQIKDVIKGHFGGEDSDLPASQKVLKGDDPLLKDKNISEYTKTKNVDEKTGETSEGFKISVAAAVAISIIEHDVIASVSGKIKKAASIAVTAENENNFITNASGSAVNNGNAISVAVAVAVNNSKTHAVLGSVENTEGNITVKANTIHNLSEGYKDKISVVAIAGSKAGQDGLFGAAGALSVLVSNAETRAYIPGNSSISTSGNLTIEAREKSKLAIRSWGGTFIKGTSGNQGQNGGSGSSEITVGVGAAFAILYANNQIVAYIGDGSAITAKSVKVSSVKEKVDYTDWEYPWDDLIDILSSDDLKDAFKPEKNDESTGISVNKEKLEPIINKLKEMDLKLEIEEYLNFIARNNYYIEAAGGILITGSSETGLSGAGSFAIMYFNTVVLH